MSARRIALAVLLVVALAGGTAAGASGPCVVSAANKYKDAFDDNAATRVDDLSDRVVESFSRDSNGQPVYPEVASKYDQPRTVAGVASFTTPHQGTDFGVQWTNEDSDVSAVADGTMVKTNATWQTSEKIDTTHYAVFTHTIHLSGYVAGRVVVAGEKIARVGSTAENGGFGEHVHFGVTLNAGLTVWRPISPYFADAAGWRNGRDLEFIGFPQVDASNRLTVSAYTLDGGAYGERFQACSAVTVFYRKKGTATWTKGVMSASASLATGVGNATWQWSFDLGAAGSPGDAVEWYVAAYRDPNAALDDYDITIEIHNFALYPARYAHPSDVASGYPAGTSPLFVTTTLK